MISFKKPMAFKYMTSMFLDLAEANTERLLDDKLYNLNILNVFGNINVIGKNVWIL